MVFGIDREHAARANHDVVDVRSAFTDANSVKDAPARIFAEHLLELSCDLLLTVRADAPCPLVVTHSKGAGQQGANWRCLLERVCLFTRHRTSPVQ
jgi:hypothetical protein